MSWLTGYRRLNHRYAHPPRNYLASLGLAAALCCYKSGLSVSPHRTRSKWDTPEYQGPGTQVSCDARDGAGVVLE